MWKDFCLISFVKLSDRLDSSCRLTWLRNVSFLSPLLSSPSCFKIKFMFSKIQLYYNVFYDVHELSHTKSNNHKNITYMLKMWMIWPNHELLKTNKIMVYNGKSNAANLGLDKTKQIPQKPRVISHAREEWTSPVPSWSANSKSYLWLHGLYWKYWAVFAILSIFYIDKTGSSETQFLRPNRKVVADRAGTNVRK